MQSYPTRTCSLGLPSTRLLGVPGGVSRVFHWNSAGNSGNVLSFYQPLDSPMGKSLLEPTRLLFFLGVIHQLLCILMTNGHRASGISITGTVQRWWFLVVNFLILVNPMRYFLPWPTMVLRNTTHWRLYLVPRLVLIHVPSVNRPHCYYHPQYPIERGNSDSDRPPQASLEHIAEAACQSLSKFVRRHGSVVSANCRPSTFT